jgi:signal transduction histidine kinase/ligand-binding sensor domain-containing protein
MVRAWVFFIFILIGPSGLAQTNGDHPPFFGMDNYIVKQYNSENGLPQNSAKDLLLDKNDFLWITTENGLARFDGQQFLLYNASNTPFLQTNRFGTISETPRREVLFLSGFNPTIVYRALSDYRLVIDSPATRLRNKLISYHSNGVFDPTPLYQDWAKHRTADTAFLDSLLHPSSYWVLNEREAVVRYLDAGYYYLNTISGEVSRLNIPLDARETQQAFFFKDIFGVLRENRAIFFFRNGRPASITIDASVEKLLRTNFPSTYPGLLIYTKGSLVIAKAGNDVYRLTIEKDTLKARLLFKGLQFLENQPFYCFQYDSSSDRLFVGTQNEGLFVITRKTFHSLAFDVKDFSSNVLMASEVLPNGNVLTTNGILDPADSRQNVLFPVADRPDRRCLYKASDGSIWLSRRHRLQIYDSSFSRLLLEDSLPLDSYITAALKGSDGSVWISTVNNLLRYTNGKLHVVLDHYPVFVKQEIETIAEISPGIFWIATRNGIYVYHVAGNSIATQPLLPHADTRSIFRARDSTIWIGTYGNGYFKYMNGGFISLPLDPQKFLAAAHAFQEDDKGFLWISTNHGLFRIKKSDLDSFCLDNNRNVFFDYFGKSLGFNTNEFNGGCNPGSIKDPNGNFYFPSLNGMVTFRPDRIVQELPDKAIFIDNFSVDSDRLDSRQSIRIKPEFNRIVVSASSPFYGLGDNLRLEYKMDPIGERWYPVEAGGKIIINRLPYGKYALHIRKMNGWGNGNFARISIPFEVLPNWYNTGWFRFSMAAVFILLVLLLFRLRNRFLLRQNTRLQRKVEERTEELEQSTMVKDQLLSVIMHDLRSPLFSMSLLIGHLRENFRRLKAQEVEDILRQLESSSRGISQFSTDFLTWYNSQLNGLTIRKESIELEAFIRETGGFYKDIADRKGISLEYEAVPGLILYSDKNILAVILRNIIDNAIKYTRSGRVSVGTEKKDGHILVSITDTGSGMTAEKIAEVLSYSESGPVLVTTSFGFRFITQLTRKLDGELHIDSEPGTGTVVTVAFRSW